MRTVLKVGSVHSQLELPSWAPAKGVAVACRQLVVCESSVVSLYFSLYFSPHASSKKTANSGGGSVLSLG